MVFICVLLGIRIIFYNFEYVNVIYLININRYYVLSNEFSFKDIVVNKIELYENELYIYFKK